MKKVHGHPSKNNRSDPIWFSPYLYRTRRIEWFVNQSRRSRTLYANYLAFIQLVSIRLWLAARYESASWHPCIFQEWKKILLAELPHS